MHDMQVARNQKLRRTSLVAPADDLDRLREIAESEHRTLSQELRRLIAERVEDDRDTDQEEAA
jgi:hypothetical protein